MKKRALFNNRGAALIVALLMSMVIMVMVTGVMYFINQSQKISGAGKRYATAEEAADGAVNVVKDTINLTLWGEPVASAILDPNGCLANAVLNQGVVCTAVIDLPGATGDRYSATITLTRLYSITLPGGRLEFARSASGVSGSAIFYRISARVVGPNNTTAENAALYRFAG